MKPVFLAAALLLLPSASHASERFVDMIKSGCTMHESATISTSFNGMSADIKEVRKVLDERLESIQTIAKKAGVEEMHLQSQNYSINTNQNNGLISGYRYNGRASFSISPVEKGTDLIEALTKENIQSSLNVNTHSSGSCR